MIIFGICFLMIYLILSALYESFIIPFQQDGCLCQQTDQHNQTCLQVNVILQSEHPCEEEVQSRPTEDWQIEEEIKVSEEEKSKAGKK